LKKIIAFLILLIFSIKSFSQKEIFKGKTPKWVTNQTYNINPQINEDDITQGTLNLLADYQINVDNQEFYFRLVTKITDNIGIQSASNIGTLFDPLYQKVTFHEVKIIRDGDEIDKLKLDNFQVMRRELNAENYLYDGSLSAMLNLSDVRNGDIIDVSYTIKGFNPIHNGNFSDTFILNDYVPIGKINLEINSSKKLYYKLFNTNLTPKITTTNKSTKYSWQVETPKESIYEEATPESKIVMPTVIVSTYKTWEDVVKWAIKHYKTNTPLNTAVKSKIEEINTSYKTEGEKIKAILNFVQNDIRYLGLEYGISSYKPNSPNKVFEQRYGDCKDKSLLMVEMLKELDIEAYPMLVNTSMKDLITKLPASPKFFNHCVVKVIDNDARTLYYDPTIFNQGGTYKNTHFPNYEYGLVIKEHNTSFETIVSFSKNKITTKEEFYINKNNAGADLNVTYTYTDVEADRVRSFLANNSKKTIQKEYEKLYNDLFDKIRITGEALIQDNIEANQLMVIQSYEIDSIWKPLKMESDALGISLTPSSLKEMLYVPNLENRKHPIQLAYPTSREHITRVILPYPWNIEENYDIVSNDVLYYEVDITKPRSNEIKLKYFLKTQKNAVEAHEFETYYNSINNIDKSFGYTIFTPNTSMNKLSKSSFFTLPNILFLLFIIGCFLFILYQLFSNKQVN